MLDSSTTPLVILLGFAIGAALYGMLLLMVLRHPDSKPGDSDGGSLESSINPLLLATSVLGLLWNLGGLFEWFSTDLLRTERSSFAVAVAYSALGFLPAVVVHSVFKKASGEDERLERGKRSLLMIAAYALSSIGAAWHLYDAIIYNLAPSFDALQMLTYGYLLILAGLLFSSLRQSIGSKAIWAMALAVFAISALHLSRPHSHGNSWFVELAGHQASLPLALAILYQDFRFAFADVFLKRALSLLLVTALACGFYWMVAGYLFSAEAVFVSTDTRFIAFNLGFWIATALMFPRISEFANWVVNKLVLRRVSYERLQSEIMKQISESDTVNLVLESVCSKFRTALTVAEASWRQTMISSDFPHQSLIDAKTNGATIVIPTTDQPSYEIALESFMGGRRLLSEEIRMLEDVALLTARRIDSLRVTHERCEQELREQEFSKLATEAELRALRAQINPHFLFNALTTISYLIQTAPDKANVTLMRLTKLLRGVLRSTDEFLTLGEEIALVEAYLEIERARFEERLDVIIEIPDTLKTLQIPSLILQPLVENAIKHGISPKRQGGTVAIKAETRGQNLVLEVQDTGSGVEYEDLRKSRSQRIGLNNVEERLRLYFKDDASLEIDSRIGFGTNVRITISLSRISPARKRQAVAA